MVCERERSSRGKERKQKKEGFNPDSTVLVKHHPLFSMQDKTTQVPSQPTESQIKISDRQTKEEKEKKKSTRKDAGKFGNKGRMPVVVNRTCRELQTPNKRRLDDAIQTASSTAARRKMRRQDARIGLSGICLAQRSSS